MSNSNQSARSKSTNKTTVRSTSLHFPQALYQRMSDDLQLNGKAERTRKGYLRAITQLANYCKQSLDKISEDQLRRYFLHIKNNLKYAYGTLRVALSGVQFFYRITCKRDWDIFSMLKLQNINALPEVITITQVHQIIDAATTLGMVVQRTVTGRQFVEGFTQHVLPAGFRKVRYHGWMCSSSKTRLEEIRMLVWFALGWIYWMASAIESTAKPNSCSKPPCPRCQSPMQVQQIEMRPGWLEPLNSHSHCRAPPTINSS